MTYVPTLLQQLMIADSPLRYHRGVVSITMRETRSVTLDIPHWDTMARNCQVELSQDEDTRWCARSQFHGMRWQVVRNLREDAVSALAGRIAEHFRGIPRSSDGHGHRI